MRKSSVLRVFACALTMFVPGLCPAGAQESGGSITGRVMQGGNPASGIILLLTRSVSDRQAMQVALEGAPIVKAVTDEDGRYRFSGLEAGRYEVSPFSPSAIVSSGNRLATLADGDSVAGIDFDLSPGGVITGTVTTADGKPVIGEAISVFPVSPTDGVKSPNPGSDTFITDDRGVYRIYGLDPGRYVVGVGTGNQGGGSPFTLHATHAQTFYPGVTVRDRAGIVDVAAGAEASRIDIKLGQPSQTYQANGRVLDDAGKPVANVVVICGSMPAENGSVTPSISTLHTNSKGEFKAEGLTPGRYTASANFMYDPGSNLYSDAARFEVKNADVAGVEVKVHKGLSLSGVAALEGTDDPGIMERLSQLELWATVVSPESSGYSLSRSKIMPDYSFRLGGLRPGKVQIMLNTITQASPFAILRIEQNGVPQREGIELGVGDQVSGIRVVFGYGNCVIRGLVSVQGGELPKDTTLDVFAVPSGEDEESLQPALGGFGFAGTHNSHVDSSGRFRIDGLVPGQYDVTVTAPQLPGNSNVPLHYPFAKQSVAVTSGGDVEVNLVLDLSKSPQ
jgi:hypothetical protein